MAQNINDNFQLNAAEPLDARKLAANTQAMFDIPWFYRYPGMQVFVVADKQWYYLDLDSAGDFTSNEFWVPLGGGTAGNYESALDGAVQMIEDVGGLNAGTPVSVLTGNPISQILDQLLFPVAGANYTQPTAALGASPAAGLIKVGNSISPSLTAVFTQNDAGAETLYELLKDGIFLTSDNPAIDVGVVSNVPDNVTYQARFTFADGPILNDSQGNPDPANQILAGTVLSSIRTYQWIYPYFWGVTVNPGAIDPATGNEILATVGNEITIDFQSTNNQYLWFAVPANEPAFTSWLVTQLNQGNIGSPSDLFGAPSVIQISSGNFANVDYDFYISNFPSAVSDPMTISQ